MSFQRFIAVLFVLAACIPAMAAESNEPVRFNVPADSELAGAAKAVLAAPAAGLASLDAFASHAKRMTELYQSVDYDPAARARQLGAGIAPSFEYVRDQIRFECYAGVFREGAGAYISRAGNAADRSLLLSQFLNSKGIATRFALGHLPDARAQELFDRMFAPMPRGKPAAGDGKAPEDPFVRRLRTRAARDYAVVLGALGSHLPASAGASRKALLDEIANHVWVQARDKDKWVDLDTSFADAAPGKTYCGADRIVAALPSEMFQRAEIRVIVEQLDGATLTRQTMLSLSRPVVDLIDRQIFLTHVPDGGLTRVGQAVAGLKGGYTPMLWIAGEPVMGKPITYSGAEAVGNAPAKPIGLGAALDALGGPAAAPPPQFVSESLEIEITCPGGKHETTRRVLCDRAPAACRLAKAPDPKTLGPLPQADGGPVAAQAIHNIWFSGGRHDMASFADAISLLLIVAQ